MLTRPAGSRLLPQALDDHAASTPQRLYASIAREADLSKGFQDVTCEDMARCVHFMAQWIKNNIGISEKFETLSYIGIPDLRGAVLFLAAVKAGYKTLLPSPRNPPATNISLMQQTACSKVLYAAEVAPVIQQIENADNSITCVAVPSFKEMIESNPEAYPFDKEFEDVKNDPILILHSSGSTGLPKPITMTHATFAVLDNERNLPKTPGRRNRDYSIWDFNGGGRFYTVFPYFHLAGFLSVTVNPIFTEASSPVFGPPQVPPSGTLLKDVFRYQDLRALYLPPSIAEQLILEPGGIEYFKNLDFLCYTGGPFSPVAGEQLSKVTELCPLYGCTEAFQVPQLAPSAEDWAWMEWSPHFKLEMEPSEDEKGTFELILFADKSTEKISALNHNLPGTPVYRTKDLFKQHPQKPGLWQYYGRRDDIIVLSNGEKFNPVPMELLIQSHPSVAGALITGTGRSQAALLIEPKQDLSPEERANLKERLWPLIEKANVLAPGQGRITNSKFLLCSSSKPFVRAGKGTVVRKLTERVYETEIRDLYAKSSQSPTQRLVMLESTLKPVFEVASISRFIRSAIADTFPTIDQLSDEDDLFVHGLDSVQLAEVINRLKTSLEQNPGVGDMSWLNTRVLYNHSTVGSLSKTLFQFLNFGSVPTGEAISPRVERMDAMVKRYTQGLVPAHRPSKTSTGPSSVALIGSTGYLGPWTLASLLDNPDIASIYCLNRSADASERTAAALKKFGIYTEASFAKVKFLECDLSQPHFGLSDASFDVLSSFADVIIYNAWNPNFSSTLPSFEKPFLQGLRNIIDWSATSPKLPHIIFISSIAAIGDYSKLHPSSPIAPETPLQSYDVAMQMGYGESKNVAEHILSAAHKTCGMPVSSLRIGQIGGCMEPGNLGAGWPVQAWLLGVIKTSQALGALPKGVTAVDWMPVDALGNIISRIAGREAAAGGVRVFNLVHPDAKPFSVFIDALKADGRVEDLPEIPLSQWLKKLDEVRGSRDKEQLARYPATRFYNFLKSLGDGKEDMRFVVENVKEVVPEGLGEITKELVGIWLREWEF
ncbi:acetyl-CoA synthetase-like protein [Delitschia confertaspora ATCC 74209]|uniref:Acetyl-CoA synthetase-like protein n=1 Tax=Delitschia confertaspora ATCC 74209 TaxID=1513339 RepID=A0A9P4MUE6_9PLEO|nr:acetyl-CoA synthetase-like protein [Delitschia confertaspora ATCC 74209]